MGYDELDIERQNENSKQIKIKIQRLKHSVKENNETDLERQNGFISNAYDELDIQRQNGFKSNAYDELDMERQNEISKEIKNEIQRLKHSYKENDELDQERQNGFKSNAYDELDIQRQNGNAYDELDMERQNENSKEIKNEIQRLKHSYKEDSQNDESDLEREDGSDSY